MKPMASASSHSREQQACEPLIIAAVGRSVGCVLSKQRIPLSSGGHLEIDACSTDRAILCEAWAHQGPPKPAQKAKVMTDAAKLFLAGQILGGRPRKILAFADRQAASVFQGKGWMAEGVCAMGIEIQVTTLPEEIRATIRAAQARQYR
jgi:hypothetical protein